MADSPIHILLIEDDEIDAEAVVRAFEQQRMVNRFTIVPDGLEAIKVLRGDEGRPPIPRPYLILLDINTPRMNGHEFLQAIRQDADLKRSIVFVFTTSNQEGDKLAAYNQQVAGYLLKSKAGTGLSNVVRLLDSYSTTVEFPPEVNYDNQQETAAPDRR